MKAFKAQMKAVFFLNGKFIPEEEAKLCVLTPGFLYGFGLFETMRSYGQKIVYFDEHLKRIQNACKLIGMRPPYPRLQLKEIIKEAVKLNCFRDAYVRLTLWKADRRTEALIIVRKYIPYPPGKYKAGFSARIFRFRQNEGSLLAGLKTTNRLLYEISFQEAKDKCFDESVILNNRGNITEASRSNIFFVKEQALFTPGLSNGCLDGITRRAIFDLAKKNKIKIYEGNFSLSDLYSAQEAFLTNSLIGVMPLVSVEKHPLGRGRVGPLTKFFMHKYNLLLKDEI